MKKLSNLKKRHYRVRSKVSGSTARPRLSIYRSNKHIFAQIIDDEKNISLVGVSSQHIKDKKLSKTAISEEIGKKLAEKALEKGVKEVVFDRGGYKYHGRIKTFADSARNSGLVF
jgi:large subunit ribosomal protein L18